MVTKQQFCPSRESNCIPYTCTRYGAAISDILCGLITSTLHKNYRFHYPEFGFISPLICASTQDILCSQECADQLKATDHTVRAECGYTQQKTNGVPGTLSGRTDFHFISYPAVRSCCKASQGRRTLAYCRPRRVGTERRSYRFAALHNHPRPPAVYHLH